MDRCLYIALADANLSRLSWAEKEDIQQLVRLLLYPESFMGIRFVRLKNRFICGSKLLWL